MNTAHIILPGEEFDPDEDVEFDDEVTEPEDDWDNVDQLEEMDCEDD